MLGRCCIIDCGSVAAPWRLAPNIWFACCDPGGATAFGCKLELLPENVKDDANKCFTDINYASFAISNFQVKLPGRTAAPGGGP